MEKILELEIILGLSRDPERLLRDVFFQTLVNAEIEIASSTNIKTSLIEQGTVLTETQKVFEPDTSPVDYNWADTFSVGAVFAKRTAMKGRQPITVTVEKVVGINVWFDSDFRCKAWKNSSRKRTMDSTAARLFLQEFKRS